MPVRKTTAIFAMWSRENAESKKESGETENDSVSMRLVRRTMYSDLIRLGTRTVSEAFDCAPGRSEPSDLSAHHLPKD